MITNALIDFFRKYFIYEIFTIAIIKNEKHQSGLLDGQDVKCLYFLPANVKKWYADPIIVEDNDKQYVFFECVEKNKGKIQVGEINEHGEVVNIQDVLECKYHLSYPFVFKIKDQWLMIPESHQNNSISLYKAIEFPNKWEHFNTIQEGSEFIDSTVLEIDNIFVLISAQRNSINESVVPLIYKINFIDSFDWKLNELSWKNYDPFRIRPAGSIFKIENEYFRPAQICTNNIYGQGLVIYKISTEKLKKGEFVEEEFVSIMPKRFENFGFKRKIIGLHTYSKTDKFEIIDIKYEVINFTYIFVRIFNKFSSRRIK